MAPLEAAIRLAALALTAEEEAACGPADEAGPVCLALFRWTGNDTLARLSEPLVVKPAKILLIVLLAILVAGLLRRAISRFVRGLKGERVRSRVRALREKAPDVILETTGSIRASQRAETIGALLRSISAVAVWGVAILMVLGELGLNLGPLIAGAGIVGVALGFGAQNLVRDFLSGIFMLIEDQYGVGDIVDAGEATGTVEAVTLRTTRLRDVNGVVWHIPNGTITRIGNHSQQWSRALIDVSVAYGTDIDQAMQILKETADAMWQTEEWSNVILEEPQVWGVQDLGPDGVTIRLVVKTLPSEQFAAQRRLRALIKQAFDREGVEIPFPQRVVWHRGVPAADVPAD